MMIMITKFTTGRIRRILLVPNENCGRNVLFKRKDFLNRFEIILDLLEALHIPLTFR